MKRFLVLCITLLSICAFAAENKPVVTIALLSDPHTTLHTNKQDGAYERHFEQAIAEVNGSSADFVLVTGDLGNNGTPEQWREFRARAKKFKAPVYFVPGNHDVGHKMNSGKPTGHITAEKLHSYEQMMGPSFFATNAHGLRIIGLNSPLLGSGLERERDQWKMLESEFSQTNDAPKIVFMHYPLFMKNADEPGGVYWNIEPEPRKRLLEMCKDARVKAVLTGHLHKALTNRYEGMLLYSTPPISFALGKGTRVAWTLVTIWKDREPTIQIKPLDQ